MNDQIILEIAGQGPDQVKITLNGTTSDVQLQPQHLQLLLLVAESGEAGVTRQRIFEAIWPHLQISVATNTFHVAKTGIHTTLGYPVIAFENGVYRLASTVTFVRT